MVIILLIIIIWAVLIKNLIKIKIQLMMFNLIRRNLLYKMRNKQISVKKLKIIIIIIVKLKKKLKKLLIIMQLTIRIILIVF